MRISENSRFLKQPLEKSQMTWNQFERDIVMLCTYRQNDGSCSDESQKYDHPIGVLFYDYFTT